LNPDPGIPLEPGEETIKWTDAKFATAIAPPVQGRRWFRDPEGRDIEPLLERQAGWPHREGPSGPPGAPPPDWRDTAAKAVSTGIKVTQVAVGIAAELAGGSSGNLGDIAVGPAKKHMNPAIESDDFPVMVAAPGTVAGSAPWQLDPARRPKSYKVFLTLTTSRIFLTGMLIRDEEWTLQGFLHTLPRELIWQIPRQYIHGAEQRKFSEGEADVIIYFNDGSWVRLHVDGNGNARKLAESLTA
jgi:hypothetical protein